MNSPVGKSRETSFNRSAANITASLGIARFCFMLYYYVTVTVRVSFQCYPIIESYSLILALDYLIDAFYVIDFFYLAHRYSPLEQTHSVTEYTKVFSTGSAFELFMLVPFELIVFGSGYENYLEFRMSKLLRLMFFRRYWDGFISQFDAYVPVAASQRIVFALIVNFLLGHFGACAAYGIAIAQSSVDPDISSMITLDNLGYMNAEGDFTVERSCAYRYLRFLYWSLNTLVCVLRIDKFIDNLLIMQFYSFILGNNRFRRFLSG
jgi:hypothetical protein